MGYCHQPVYKITTNDQSYRADGLIVGLPGLLASATAPRGHWSREHFLTHPQLLLRIERQVGQHRFDLAGKRTPQLQPLNPGFRKRHAVTRTTEVHFAPRTLSLKTMNGLSEVCVQTAHDSSLTDAWLPLNTTRLPSTTVHLLSRVVLPSSEENGRRISTMSSSNGKGRSCRRDHLRRKLPLQIARVVNPTTRAPRRPSAGVLDCLPRTLLENHSRIPHYLRRHGTVQATTTDLPQHPKHYNRRPRDPAIGMDVRTPWEVSPAGPTPTAEPQRKEEPPTTIEAASATSLRRSGDNGPLSPTNWCVHLRGWTHLSEKRSSDSFTNRMPRSHTTVQRTHKGGPRCDHS